MKKRALSLLLAAAMVLSISACGKKDETESGTASSTGTQTSIAEDNGYVEELPAKNELDPANPIPADTGTLELHEYISDLTNVRIMLPDGTHVEEGEIDSYGNSHSYVYDDAGEWAIEFRGMHLPIAELETSVHGLNSNPQQDNGTDAKIDWSKDISGSFAGFPARFWANNIQGYIANNDDGVPAVVIWLDYGDTISGQWYGLQVRLTAQNPVRDETNIYELLYRRAVRAVLNNFEVIETGDGALIESNGFSVILPTRYKVVSTNPVVSTVKLSEFTGSVQLLTNPGSDPAQTAEKMGDQPFTRTYGDITWNGTYQIREQTDSEGNTLEPQYMAYFFAPFSDKRIMQVVLHSMDYSIDDYEEFFDSEMFSGIMESVKLDPASWKDPILAAADGFTASIYGDLEGYDGPDADIEIPAEIGDIAVKTVSGFRGNSQIKSVVIPEGVNWIRGDAFRDCENLEKVVIPSTVSVIGGNAFENCPKLTTVVFSEGLSEIEHDAFSKCPSLKDVVLPESLVRVGGWGFSESGAGTFSGPAAVYDQYCFQKTTFESMTFADGADLSARSMFSWTKARHIELPGDIEVIGENMFNVAENLEEIVLPNSVTTLDPTSFVNVHALGTFHVVLSESLTEIPENCFLGTQLDVVVIPDNIKKIGYHAITANVMFLGNSDIELADYAIDVDVLSLVGIYSPDDMPANLGKQSSFSGVRLPMDATLAESDAIDAYLASIGQNQVAWIGTMPDTYPEDFMNYTQDGRFITAYTGSSDTISIPYYGEDNYNRTVWVKERAFAGNTAITTVYLNDTVTLEGHAFDGCSSIKSVYMNAGVLDNGDTYDAECFAGMPEGMTVYLPESLTADEVARAKTFCTDRGMPASARFETYSYR